MIVFLGRRLMLVIFLPSLDAKLTDGAGREAPYSTSPSDA